MKLSVAAWKLAYVKQVDGHILSRKLGRCKHCGCISLEGAMCGDCNQFTSPFVRMSVPCSLWNDSKTTFLACFDSDIFPVSIYLYFDLIYMTKRHVHVLADGSHCSF